MQQIFFLNVIYIVHTNDKILILILVSSYDDLYDKKKIFINTSYKV